MTAFTVSVKNSLVKMTLGCLATFCCYDYGANASEAVEKIATDQKDYHKCSLCVIVCCIKRVNIVGYWDTSGV